MKKSNFYFAVLLILVVIIAVLGFLILQRRAPEEPPAVSETPDSAVENTAAPSPTEQPSVPPTEQPSVPPTEQPEETPELTPSPAPGDASGSFASSTGTGLNLRIDWHTFTDAAGTAKLQVDVSTVSYSFFTSALYQSIVLSLDGQTYAANSAEVSYDGTDLAVTPMASFTVDAPASGTPISVTWHYRGSYSGKQLDEIVADGVIVY